MHMPLNRLAVDPHKFVIDGKGLKDFFDPVPREELEEFRNALLPCTAAFGRTLERRIDRDTVACCAGHFALFVLRCFRAAQLVKRCDASHVEIILPEQDFLAAFMRSDLAPPEAFAKRLLQGPPPRQAWKAPARFIRNLLRRSIIRDGEFRSVDLENAIAVTSISQLIQKHASAIDDTVVYCHPSRWFGRLSPLTSMGLASIRNGLVESARQAYALVGANFDIASEKMIFRWAEIVPAAAQAHLIKLESKTIKLPRRLWIGSSGQIWSRILAHAVRSAEGEITGHDHGAGIGFLRANVKAINDFEVVNQFLTFTDMQVKGIERTYRDDIVVRPDRPRIGVAPGARLLSFPPAKSRQGPPIGKKVMIVTSYFSGSGVAIYPGESDYVRLDWYARLIVWLRSKGFEVLLKPHPECVYGIPQALRSLADDCVLHEPFGKIWEKADILLYDYPLSTSFGEGLFHDRPIVFVGFQLNSFDRVALDLLSLRCAIVEGYKDENGRRQVDWSALSEAFTTAPKLSDPAFFEAYLAY